MSSTHRGQVNHAPSRRGAVPSRNQDVLSDLWRLPEGAGRTERALALARALAEIKRRVSPVLQKHHITRAFLFGSTPRGDIHKGSDIDIAIELPKDSTMDLVDFVGLGLELEAVLGRKVDIVNIATMKPRIRERAEIDQVSLL